MLNIIFFPFHWRDVGLKRRLDFEGLAMVVRGSDAILVLAQSRQFVMAALFLDFDVRILPKVRMTQEVFNNTVFHIYCYFSFFLLVLSVCGGHAVLGATTV